MDRIYRCKSSCFWHYYMKRIDNIYIYFYIHFYKCAEILIQHLHQYGRTLELSGHWEIFNFGNRNRQTLFIPWTLFRAFRLGDCRLCLCVIARAQCCTTDAASILLRSARSRSITKQVIQTVMFCLPTFTVLNSKLREIMDSNPRPLP